MVSLCVSFAPPMAGAERAEILQAINWVENPTNHSRQGSKGELGPYQFRVQTWRMHTRKPFQLAVIREHADEVAIKHFEWLKKGLVLAGIDPSPFNIAMAWNCGLTAVTSGRVPVVTYHYAERVHNLVEVQANQRTAMVAAVQDPAFGVVAKPAVRFSLDVPAPLFIVATESLYEPTVVTDKSPVRVGGAEKPIFTIGVVAAPSFALIQ